MKTLITLIKSNDLFPPYFRSITEDQASVYRQVASMMSTAGIDGKGCLQYVICKISERTDGQNSGNYDSGVKENGGNDRDGKVNGDTKIETNKNGNKYDSKESNNKQTDSKENGGEEYSNTENDGLGCSSADSCKKGNNKKRTGFNKKKGTKPSLIADILATLLL